MPTDEFPSGANIPGAPGPDVADGARAAHAHAAVQVPGAEDKPGARPDPASPQADFEETLKRLVDQVAKLLQAEKCVFFMHDASADTLYATYPALGFTREELHNMGRNVADPGLTSEVFRSNEKVIVPNAAEDERAATEDLPGHGIRNCASVPLIVERRDEENRILDKTTVGVLHACNKKNGKSWVKEDLWLLERMALTGATVIKCAQLYRDAIQKEQEFIHAIDSLYAGLIVIGTNGRIQQINPSARRILMIDMEAPIIGAPYDTAIHNDGVCRLLRSGLRTASHEVAGEIVIGVPDGDMHEGIAERTYQIQCAPVRDESGVPAGIVVIFNDITEIRSVERMKDSFIATVSHELRTPLTSIKGFIATLLDDENSYYDKGARREFYQIINTECDRLSRLIGDLLDISIIEHGRAMQLNWREVDLAALCHKVAEIQGAATKSHTLDVEAAEDLPPIEGDPDKLDQIVTNLVSNAIKYSPRGGRVHVIAERAPDKDECVRIRVVDEGIGIPREHHAKLFERFYRVDNRDTREIGGTGIGLALVKGLTDAHHGTVSVESEPGHGATFTVTLPIRQTQGECQ